MDSIIEEAKLFFSKQNCSCEKYNHHDSSNNNKSPKKNQKQKQKKQVQTEIYNLFKKKRKE